MTGFMVILEIDPQYIVTLIRAACMVRIDPTRGGDTISTLGHTLK